MSAGKPAHLVIHGWDLARATGQPFRCDAATAEVTRQFLTETGEQGRAMGIYAAAVPVDASASALDQALALINQTLDEALAEQDLDTALGVAAEMLVSARQAPATRQAAATVLAHLARHPLARSPALGAFVAALTE